MKSTLQQERERDSGNGSNHASHPNNSRGKALVWLRKLGWAGFLFFLIKGLVWIAVFYGLGRYVGLGSGE
ncbi:MAG: hypothetical protein FJ350_05970 [Sphingomonadales bacterium]|nr:hypothetical protein [Sphingomonadales bacterium]MBM3931462.1 hypothetical protein [Sphingomonadales bacterium]